jgi:hypothetical protein
VYAVQGIFSTPAAPGGSAGNTSLTETALAWTVDIEIS